MTIPTSGHDFSGNTRHRITLTVTDSTGLTDTRSVLIYPQKVNLSFSTTPAGLTVYLDGVAKTTPFVYDTLVGFSHTVEARNQTSGGNLVHVRLMVGRRGADPHDRRTSGRSKLRRHLPGERGSTGDRRVCVLMRGRGRRLRMRQGVG